MIRGEWPRAGQTISTQEFEDLQLKALEVFCRRCGLVDDLAVPMEHVDVADVDLTSAVLPGADQGYVRMHVYSCPRCRHRAASEAHESPHA